MAIARDARDVLDKGAAAAGDAVEKCRFSDIRAAHEGDDGARGDWGGVESQGAVLCLCVDVGLRGGKGIRRCVSHGRLGSVDLVGWNAWGRWTGGRGRRR